MKQHIILVLIAAPLATSACAHTEPSQRASTPQPADEYVIDEPTAEELAIEEQRLQEVQPNQGRSCLETFDKETCESLYRVGTRGAR